MLFMFGMPQCGNVLDIQDSTDQCQSATSAGLYTIIRLLLSYRIAKLSL